MKVEVIKMDNKNRYLLIDDNGELNVSVSKFLKHLDNVGRSSNTLRTYCYALKLYFEFLDTMNKTFDSITFQDLSDFIGWLKMPSNNDNVIELYLSEVKQRSNKTINLTSNIVLSFYDYLFREEMIGEKITDVVFKKSFNGSKSPYKTFLTHIQSEKPNVKNVLKLKTPKKKIKILSKEEIKAIYEACSNTRDRFLIQLLYETGFRIGEVLSLRIEDFEMDPIDGHKIHLVDRGELENGASLKSGERSVIISDELMEMFDDYLYEILDNLDSDFVFVKLNGNNKSNPLEYEDVQALMKRLSKKTNIKVTAHMFRHTHATQFYQQTKNIKATQERLGHADIQTTMNMYVHTTDEERRKEWELAKESFDLSHIIDEGD